MAIHGIVLAIGALLAWSVRLTPLAYLGLEGGLAVSVLAAGVLVSCGGTLLDEALRAVREFKEAYVKVWQARLS